METIVSRNVADLPLDGLRSLEGLIGVPLDRGQQVLIMVRPAGEVPTEADRIAAATGLRQLISQAESYADDRLISDEESTAAIDEAMAKVRRR